MAKFPNDEHYKALSEKGFGGRTSDDDLWAWHAYTYGWRRIMLQTRDDISPIDVRHEWFNASFAAAAEIYWSQKLRIRAPDLAAAQRVDNSPDEIASMLARSAAARRYIADVVASNVTSLSRHQAQRKVDSDRDRDAIRRVHEDLGVTANESRSPVSDAQEREINAN